MSIFFVLLARPDVLRSLLSLIGAQASKLGASLCEVRNFAENDVFDEKKGE